MKSSGRTASGKDGVDRLFQAADDAQKRAIPAQAPNISPKLLWLQTHPQDWLHWWTKIALAKTKIDPGWPQSP